MPSARKPKSKNRRREPREEPDERRDSRRRRKAARARLAHAEIDEELSIDAVTPEGPPEERDRHLEDPDLFLNRELSLLEFNRRVLAQAEDPATPLLERLRFLCICTSNLDEFFEVRVAGLREQIALGIHSRTADALPPDEVLRRISRKTHELVRAQYELLSDHILPALAEEGVDVLFRDRWDDAIRGWSKSYFDSEVLPVLTPQALDPAHPFPNIVNKSLNFFVKLEGKDAFGRSCEGAVVQAPRLLPRLIEIPEELCDGRDRFVPLSSLITAHASRLFPGMKVTGCFAFRVTRNSDLWVNEEEVDDLLRALKGELPQRHFGDSVRLEVDDKCPPEIRALLLDEFHLGRGDEYPVKGPVNMHRLGVLYDMVDRPDLEFPAFTPRRPEALAMGEDFFRVLAERDVLLHHPYESFLPVEELLRTAARDPSVLAIKVTLYRTGRDSPLLEALTDAALNGKEVTAIVELRARFDEAANIETATRLQKAGAKVAYGIVGYKAHAKMILIVRRDADGIRRYVHLGTGNYHRGNTNSYTDFGLLTAEPEIAADVHSLFQQLTGLGKASKMRKLLQAPFSLHSRVLELIDAERRAAEAGKPSGIRAKMNSLIEPRVIRALYKASRAGVPIELVVRGVCCLKPGLPGVSETIHVRSIVGRFLEHARIYHFHAGGEDVVYCSSADWMQRNFFRRVEAAFPIEDPALKSRVLREGLDLYLADDRQAWILRPDGTYARAEGKGHHCAQDVLMRGDAAS